MVCAYSLYQQKDLMPYAEAQTTSDQRRSTVDFVMLFLSGAHGAHILYLVELPNPLPR